MSNPLEMPTTSHLTPCEECGDAGAPCCADEHCHLCNRHYVTMCQRMNADPIECPLRSEMMTVKYE
jgi:hypothetical protein